MPDLMYKIESTSRSLPRFCHDTLVLSAFDILQGPKEVSLRVLHVRRTALLISRQVGMYELDQAIQVLGGDLDMS